MKVPFKLLFLLSIFNWHVAGETAKRSLIFVCDATFSMKNDLQQLREGATKILETFANLDEHPIKNYVLSIFRDREVDPVINTTNYEVIKNALKNIVLGGSLANRFIHHDCPEHSLHGILESLKYAEPKSLIFVFTDDDANDFYIEDEVREILLRKQISVNFMLTYSLVDYPPHTKTCKKTRNSARPGYAVYERLARDTNGLIYNMNKRNVEEVLVAISPKIKSNFVSIAHKEYSQGGQHTNEVEIGEGVLSLLITVVGRNPTLEVRDPNRKVYRGVALGDNGQTLMIEKPIPGIYTLMTTDAYAYSIEVGGLSEDTFDYGFSVDVPRTKSDTAYQPIQGRENVLSIFVSNPQYSGSLRAIRLYQNGVVVRQLSLMKIRDDLYVTQPTYFDERSFKIGFSGYDPQSNPFERVISTALQPIIEEKAQFEYGFSVNIPQTKGDTQPQPVPGYKNYISIFVLNGSVGFLRTAKIYRNGVEVKEVPMRKVTDDFYVSTEALHFTDYAVQVNISNSTKLNYQEATTTTEPDFNNIVTPNPIHSVVMEYRYSWSTPNDQEETFEKPIKDSLNMLSIFIDNPYLIEKLTSVSIMESGRPTKELKLKKIRDNLYVTDLTYFPSGSFYIRLNGTEKNGKTMSWTSAGFKTVDTSSNELPSIKSSFRYPPGGPYEKTFFVEDGISLLKVKAIGNNPYLIVKNPLNDSYVADPRSDNVQMLSFPSPMVGVWTITTQDSASFSVELEMVRAILMECGFSSRRPENKDQISKIPIKGTQNIISVFTTTPQHIGDLTTAKIIQNRRVVKIIELHRYKSGYVSDPVDLPDGDFEIFVEGRDSIHNLIIKKFKPEDDSANNIVDPLPYPYPYPYPIPTTTTTLAPTMAPVRTTTEGLFEVPDDTELKELLTEWNYGQFIQKFLREQITIDMLRYTLPECGVFKLFDGYPLGKAVDFYGKLKSWRIQNRFSECP